MLLKMLAMKSYLEALHRITIIIKIITKKVRQFQLNHMTTKPTKDTTKNQLSSPTKLLRMMLENQVLEGEYNFQLHQKTIMLSEAIMVDTKEQESEKDTPSLYNKR